MRSVTAAASRKVRPEAKTSSKTRGSKTRTQSNTLTALRRQEIVQAAIKIFSRRGFDAARAEDIAHAAKIAKGTLYLYFRSKEALYSAVIAHAVQELQTLSAQHIEAADTFTEKLTAAISVRLHFWTEHQALYRLLLTLGREPKHRRQTNDLLRSGQQHLLELFTEAIAAKQIAKGDYTSLAWAILDMIRGATERRMEKLSIFSVDEDAKALTAFALKAAGVS
ncbi:MAG: TetR/AcrR family transcriptional regulator [Janthinobacterium lividum]